jgi:hypothetical protein
MMWQTAGVPAILAFSIIELLFAVFEEGIL